MANADYKKTLVYGNVLFSLAGTGAVDKDVKSIAFMYLKNEHPVKGKPTTSHFLAWDSE